METYRAGYSGRPCLNLSSSVGWGYRYLVWDAKLVQYLINVAWTERGYPLLKVDGKIGNLSDKAIRAYAKLAEITHSPGVVSKVVVGVLPHAYIHLFTYLTMGYNVAFGPGLNPDQCSELIVNRPLPAKYPPMPTDLRANLKEVWSKA